MSRRHLALIGLAVIVLLPLARAADPASQPAKFEPVDFHKLQDLMPDKALGVNRSRNDGERSDIGPCFISKANADYTNPNSDGSDAHAAISVIDFGGSPNMVAGMTTWR